MKQLIQGALAAGLNRAQAYELWSRAILLKKAKVFQELLKHVLKYSTWSEVESMVRKYQLSKEQHQLLKAAYYRYQPKSPRQSD